jgi:hypothetical protein
MNAQPLAKDPVVVAPILPERVKGTTIVDPFWVNLLRKNLMPQNFPPPSGNVQASVNISKTKSVEIQTREQPKMGNRTSTEGIAQIVEIQTGKPWKRRKI